MRLESKDRRGAIRALDDPAAVVAIAAGPDGPDLVAADDAEYESRR